MDDFVDIFTQRLMRNNKNVRSVLAVERSMSQYGITRPLTVEVRNVLKYLPKTPVRREDEVLRQLKCSKFPKTEHEVAHKLHDLYVFCDVGKSLESDAIASAVTKTIRAIEDSLPPPGKRQGASTKKESLNTEKAKTLQVGERTRKDLDKYRQVGEIKRKLYSMPDYVRNRNQKCVKLPQTKIKSPTQHLNLNISKVRGLKTKVGRVIVRQEAKFKKIEDLKQLMNPFSKKIKIIKQN